MPNVGVVSEQHIEHWDEMLNVHPLIDNDIEKLRGYIRFIHQELSPEEKGADLGIAMFIADGIQGATAGIGEAVEVNRISAEVNNRMFAHLLYNREMHQLEFVDDEVKENPTPKLIEMAQSVMDKFEITDELTFTEIGIKGIEFMADEILD